MIYKFSQMVPVDRSGVFLIKVFHLYRGSKRTVARVGDFVKTSVRVVKPEIKIKKKAKINAILVRLKKNKNRFDGSSIIFRDNSPILLKKRLTPRGKELFGPIDYTIKRKKFSSSFTGKM